MAGQEAKAAYADDMETDPADLEEGAEQEQPPAAKLLSFLSIPNLATTLDEQKLSEISGKAIDGYKLDLASCSEWKERNEKGIELATLIAGEDKDYPFKGAANVKYPLITVGALQFNARAYPAIIQGDRVCKVKVNGHDGPITDPQSGQVIRPGGLKATRAERVSEHTSWQLTSEMPEWEEDTDRLTLLVSITGAMFRKRYWDPTLSRQCSRLLTPDRLVINYRSRSLEDVPRISERLSLYPYEIQERIRDGRFVEFEYGQAQPDPEDKNAQSGDDEDAPHEFIEQHRLLDLDEDGYAEPYIVTVHLATEKVCRIVPNFDADSVRVTPEGKVAAIRKRDFYVKYLFFPSPDGGAYGMGFGSLLKSTNEAINTTLNEMLDAGHLSNTQGGFISASAGIREKTFRFSRTPGEFKVVNTTLPLNQAIMPLPFSGPSATLFQLLGLLIEQGREISSTKEILTGDTGGKVMQPTTVMALIEQGMKVYNAIVKRIFRSVKRELEMHARLNAEHLSAEVYNQFFDGPEPYDPKADYDLKSMDISPVADPSVSTATQKMARANVIRELAGPPGSKPWINYIEVDKRAFGAADVEDMDALFMPPPQPDPFVDAMKEMNLLELKATIEKLETEVTKNDTASLLNIANAAAAEAGEQTNAYAMLLKYFQAEHGMERDNAQVPGGPGGLPGMAGEPGDEMGAGPLPPPGNGNSGAGAGLAADQGLGPALGMGADATGAGAQQGPM
jgi:chaperonin GroES